MKIDWKRKLTSRKFWAMIAGIITGLLIYFNSPDRSPEKLASVIEIGCSLAAYIFGEAIADMGNSGNQNASQPSEDEEDEPDETMV